VYQHRRLPWLLHRDRELLRLDLLHHLYRQDRLDRILDLWPRNDMLVSKPTFLFVSFYPSSHIY
jgi:hypothetical protein